MYWTNVIVLCFTIFSGTRALSCTQRDLCSCSMDDGSGDVDVSTLGNQDGSPMFKDMIAADGFQYSLNLCYPFNEISCTNTSACQITTNGTSGFAIGDSANVKFSMDTLNQVHIKYTNTDGNGVVRITDVTMICSPSADPPIVTTNGETLKGSLIYEFILYSKCGCAGQCDTKSQPPNRSTGVLSVGTTIIIVALSLGFSYMVGGILYMKMIRHTNGKEIIPNLSFWGSLPGLVKTISIHLGFYPFVMFQKLDLTDSKS
ncbi:uncharacterized protein LOC132565488 [Ylistrum balloti]|uniref:uncharacterized protein LOC132565488 n=1 Tax=Ylistrum balloti TaxID=509963 RepID=UPI002905D5B6|nr:uncharacterized protein LOC132565488 [Ylistrum balloti]